MGVETVGGTSWAQPTADVLVVPPFTTWILVNGQAGGLHPAWEHDVRQGLSSTGRVEFLYPDSADELERIARASRAPGDQVLVAGGDGTINRVLNGIELAATKLGVLPLGTANDLARALGLPLTARAAAASVTVGRRRRIDVLSVNGRRFCTVGGLGLAADGALAVQALRARGSLFRDVLGRLGLHAYWMMAGARVLGSVTRAQRMQIVVRTPDGHQETLSANADALLVANQSTLGGRLRVSPTSRHDDGVFELCVLQSKSRIALLSTLARVAAGGTMSTSEARIIPATWARISCDTELPFFGDGELLVRASTFELSIDARALDVISA